MYEQKQSAHFIGRDKEIAAFTRWLDNPDAPWIFFIHDAAEEVDKKGGVGKSRLLRKYAEIAQQTHNQVATVTVDFFNLGDRDRIFLAERVVAGIQQLYPDWLPTSFTTVIQKYRGRESGSEAASIPVSSESSDLKIQEEVAAALADDLLDLDTHLAQKRKILLIFFDTFERIEQNPRIAVLRPSQFFPDNYQFTNMRVVIAGRNKPDWTQLNWQGREQEVLTLALEPFNQQEMLRMVEAESIYEIPTRSDQELALYERTEGRPIIIGLAIDVLNHRILTLEDLLAVSKAEFEGYLVPQVNQLENPLNWVILLMAHVYHRFNSTILEWLLNSVKWSEPIVPITGEELAKVLPELSFVRRPSLGDDFVLHDEMRRLVNHYCWEVLDTDKRVRKDISRSIIKYYEQQMEEKLNEEQRQEYIIDTLYHRLFIDVVDGLNYYQKHFNTAVRFYKTAFARLLLYEAQKFTDDMSPAQRNELQYAEAALLRAEENPTPALSILHQLEKEADPQWFASNQASILTEEGWCYTQQGKLSAALDSYTKALEITRAEGHELHSAQLLRYIGTIFRRRGQFSTALTYFEQSMGIYKKLGRRRDYSTALNEMSIVYRRQGKLEEAMRWCKVAWRIRVELFQHEIIGEDLVGLSLNVLGGIYQDAGNLVEAEKRYREAFDIFLRTNYKAGTAIIYNRLGHIELLKGNLVGAQEWFLKGQEASREIERDQYINSLNKQGRIRALQQKWSEAVPLFEQAIAIAQQVPDYYQQTESLIDLADALDHLQQKERVQQSLQEAEEISIQENYLDLRGLIEKTRGEINYRNGEYDAAFHHFALYCHHMALYNSSEFSKAVQRVVDALLEVPREKVPALAQEILTYWTTKQLNKSYPELISAFEEVDALMAI